MIHRHFLDNGLELLVIREKTSQIGFATIIRIGSVFEEPTRRGISHFLEHMIFKSNEKYKSKEVSRVVEHAGFLMNGFTTHSYTTVFFYGNSNSLEHFKKALDVVYYMLTSQKFDKEEFLNEKYIILSELSQLVDDPNSFLEMLTPMAVFGDSDYGAPTIGTKESISAIELEDLIEFKKSYYTPDNMTILLTGDVHEEHIRSVSEIFSKMGGKCRQKKTPCSGKEKDISINRDMRDVAYISYAAEIPPIPREAMIFADLFSSEGASSPTFEIFRDMYSLGYHSEFAISKIHDKLMMELSFFGIAKEKVPILRTAIEKFSTYMRDMLSNEEVLNGRRRYVKTTLTNHYSSMENRLLGYVSMCAEDKEIKVIDERYIHQIVHSTTNIPLPHEDMRRVVIE
ncbi:MAG: pitrilysin family protein [Candidatus Korarchaeota archaeon]